MLRCLKYTMEMDSYKTPICSGPNWHGISGIRITIE